MESGSDGFRFGSSVRVGVDRTAYLFVDGAQCQCHMWVFGCFGGGIYIMNVLPRCPLQVIGPSGRPQTSQTETVQIRRQRTCTLVRTQALPW